MDVISNIHNDIHKGALQLIAEHRGILLVRARELCGNETDAEELVIRTIDKAIRKIDTYSGDGSVLGWMKAILENLHRNDCRNPVVKGTCAVDDESLERLAGLDWKTDEEILAHSDSEALRAELERLDPKYSRVLLMRYYNGFSIREIARILNRPTGTVSRRLQIARQILAGKLGAKLGKAKKPLGVIAAVLLAAGAAFGLTKTVRWLAGERQESVGGAVAVQAEAVVQKVQDVKEETKMNAKQVVASAVMAASVVSAGPLPEGYQQVDWIGLDGRQWLDTGFTPTSPKFGFMFDFVYTNEVATSGCRQLLGSSSYNNGWKGGLILNGYANPGTRGQLAFCGTSMSDPGIVKNVRLQLEVKNGVFETTAVNDPSYPGASGTLTQTDMKGFGGSIYLGIIHYNGTPSAGGMCGRFYRFKVYGEDGETIHDFIPAYCEASDAFGLYDIVGDAGFRQSIGQAPFVGALGFSVVGSPSDFGQPEPDYGLVPGLEAGVQKTFRCPEKVVLPSGVAQVTCLGWSLDKGDGTVLSGTENEVTVDYDDSYQGARLTWLWSEPSLTDDGYILLDYVTLDGGQWMDTGFVPQTSSLGFYLDYVYANVVGRENVRQIMGSGINGTVGLKLGGWNMTDSRSRGEFYYGKDGLPDAGVVRNVRVQAEVKDGFYITSSGDPAYVGARSPVGELSPSDLNGPIYLGIANASPLSSVGGMSGRVYRFKLSDGKALAHDFVPAYRKADRAVGFLDLVGTAGFRESIGPRPFVAGPACGGGSLKVAGYPQELGTPSGGYGLRELPEVGEVMELSCSAWAVDAKHAVWACRGWRLVTQDGTVTAGAGTSTTVRGAADVSMLTLTWVWERTGELSDGYVPLDYIGLDGEQHLDTGYAPQDAQFGIFVDFVYDNAVSTTDSRQILGCSYFGSNWTGGLILNGYADTGTRGQLFLGKTKSVDPGIESGRRLQFELRNATYHMTCRNNPDYQVEYGTVQNATTAGFKETIYLGYVHYNGTPGKGGMSGRFYRFKIFDAKGATIHDFVPAKNAEGAVGMLDIVGDKGFRVSLGDRAFIAGPAAAGEHLFVRGEPGDYCAGLPDAYGTVGGVTVGESLTFNCPASVTNATKTLAFACTGWRLTKADGTATSGQGRSATFTYDESMRGATLTWLWAGCPQMPKDDYSVLRSLRSSGAQYVDTGVWMVLGTRVVTDVKMLGAGENGVSGNTLKEFGFGCAERFFVSVNELGERASIDRPADARRLVDLTVGGKVTVDGVPTDWSLQDRELADSGSFCLFALRDQMLSAITGYARERIYGCQMFLDGRVLRWLVPAKRLSDGKVGLYDAMNDKFYPNMGTGSDLKGESGFMLLVY